MCESLVAGISMHCHGKGWPNSDVLMLGPSHLHHSREYLTATNTVEGWQLCPDAINFGDIANFRKIIIGLAFLLLAFYFN